MRMYLTAITVASVALTLGTGPGAGAAPDDPLPPGRSVEGDRSGGAAPDVDVRPSGRVRPPSAAQRDAARDLAGVQVVFDTATALPSRMARYGGEMTSRSDAPAEQVARAFVSDHRALFLLSGDALARFVTVAQDATPGFTAVTLQQTDQGRDVLGARLTIGVDRLGRVLSYTGSYRLETTNASQPSLWAANAVQVALAKVDEQVSDLEVTSRRGGPERRTTFDNSVATDVRDPSDLTARLVSFPMPDGQSSRLAWQTVTEVDKVGAYESVVDALTGDLLARQNLYDFDAEGNIFTTQHPGIAGAVQQIVPFTGASFDNNGWVGNNRETNGNNVNAYQDTDGNDASDFQPQTPASGDPAFQHFNYPFTNAWGTSGGTDITTDQAAVVTQMFYYTNKFHDYFYGLGFDEASRNFQVDNFGRGGSGSDPILAEADDSYLTEGCNANFGTPADGSSPRMQMFVGKTSCSNNDMQRAMNGDTIFHEISHGVSNRLVAGGSLGAGAQTDAMGEGWGDFFATSYWNDPVYGDYNNGNTTIGIRRVAYDTSTLNYSSLCSGGCEEHNDGEIWATVLWDLRARMIARDGYSAGRPDSTPASLDGNRRAQQLVIDAMKLSATAPDFLDERDMILSADTARYAGADQCLIWGAFAARQMGFSATSAANQTTITTATDGPAACTPVAAAGGPYSTTEGTDVQLDASGSTEKGDGPFTYAWDLDNDGAYDDALVKKPSFTSVERRRLPGRSMLTNANGFSSTSASVVNVSNVKPAIGVISVTTPVAEGAAVAVSGLVTDPGWLDHPLSATINFGDGTGPQAMGGTKEGVRPDASLTYAVNHTYGDNGGFLVTICAGDDDTLPPSNCRSAGPIIVSNVNPTLTPDLSGLTVVNGVPTYLAHAGQPVSFSSTRVQDPGSDDESLRWMWDDGTPDSLATSLVNPPLIDPANSPSVQPRDLVDTRSHTFSTACLSSVGTPGDL